MRIPIVNEKDEIIGEEERSIIHKNGIKHREIHVWLVTPEKKFIFQKRGLNQDTWPGFLDVTCGGHVDLPNESYEECAERELLEEAGVKIPIKFIQKVYSESYDPNTDTKNNVFRVTYSGLYEGNISDLKIEDEAGLGFITFSIDELKNLKEEEKTKIIPRFLTEEYMLVFKKILNITFDENKS